MTEQTSNSEITLLKYKRDSICKKINNLHIKSQTLSIEASLDQIADFKVRCEQLQSLYEQFEHYQTDLVEILIPLNKPTELDEIEKKNEEIDQQYYSILTAKDKFLPKSTKPETKLSDQPNAATSVKLPKINLPMFDGILKEWPHFKDLYVALVHNNSALSPIEKFHFLLSTTKGEPNAIIKSLPICANNYDLVWTQLNDRYDNKRRLADQYVEEIFNLSPIQFESPKPLRNLLDTLNENVSALKQMDIENLSDFIILHSALKCIDKHSRQLFERKFSDKDYPTLDDLLEFLKDHCKSLEAAGDTKSTVKPQNKSNFSKTTQSKQFSTTPTNKSFLVNSNQTKPSMSCLYCNGDHLIHHCPTYLQLTVNERRSFIKTKQACFNCLNTTHMLSNCKSNHKCFKCKKSHHTSLHEDNFSPKAQMPPSQNVKPKEDETLTVPATAALTSTTHLSKVPSPSSTTTLLGTALVHIQDSSGNFQLARALIDPGSQSSFITETCVQRLSLARRKCHQSISGLSETSISGEKGYVSCSIKPRTQVTPTLQTNAIILNRITSSLPSVELHHDVKHYFKNWILADPNFHNPGEVDFLMGADMFPELFDGGRYKTPAGYPTAFHTIFGWLLLGQTKLSPPSSTSPSISVNLAITNHETLDHNLRKFWEIEELPVVDIQSPEDKLCESIYSSTVQRTSTGRFSVNLPFKSEPPNLGTSFERAKNCLLSLERKFDQNLDYKATYCNFMKEYETLDHMTKVDTTVVPGYYIPHHGIFKAGNAPNSTPKLRVVFNASAQTSSGKSLNDELLTGPKLQADICKILFQFRLHPYVFTTDIEKMYRQILINPDQRKYQAILWRDSPNDPISTYLLNTVTYGMSSSPFIAIRTLHQLAYEQSENFPKASKVILNSMFVDDVLTGGSSLKEAQEIKTELIELLNLGGFQLRKWSSNDPRLLSDVPSNHQEFVFQEDKHENTGIKILGLKWNPELDIFSYDVTIGQVTYTKRGILSQVAKVYDPLGLITPVVLWAKALIQKIWTLGLNWDDTLPDDLINQCDQFFNELPTLSKLAIPRFVLPTDYNDVQLHGFSDASMTGYGCAVYLRIVKPNNEILIQLLMAKSKVAPLKNLSIPRLELCGALLLSKTIHFCKSTLLNTDQLKNIPIFAWTDSMVALHWIRTSPHQLKTFTANRVSEIQTLTEPVNWHHTPTTTNPADAASRGLLPHEIINNSLWWTGPDWLKEEQQCWPKQPLPELSCEESKTEFQPIQSLVSVSGDKENPEILTFMEKYSSLTKLQTCLGWMLRFINNCRKSKEEKTTSSFLTATERRDSLHLLVKLTQSHYFNGDIESISTGKPCSPSVQKLDPFLDEDKIARVGGRLKNSSLSYSAKHPMVLPKTCHLTNLIIDHFHSEHLHVGPRTLQSILVRQFWIISARQIIRYRLSKCVICTKMKGKSLQPYMGNLPEVRLKPTRPFIKVGVDFGGPFITKSEKSRKPQMQKSYVCLFVCLSTKAIHLELVSSLSTDAFLASLDRFVSRRGLCTDIYSDHGTNFIGAERELKEIHDLLSTPKTSDVILSKLSKQGISWHFIPPLAPHFGGLWESGIKSTKHHLRRVLGNQTLTFEEFSTLLVKIEAILNSRPLTSLSPDANEYSTLTPGHFLIGEPLVALPQYDFNDTPTNRLSRWQLIQQTQQSFWKIWSNDYLHQLQQRNKWNRHTTNLKLGDLVLLKDKNLPPLKWSTGRVINTHPGKDGVVRVVTLKTPNGLFRRAVVQVCPLPSDS